MKPLWFESVAKFMKFRCKLRCTFRARPGPEEQGCDQIQGTENKQVGEYQSNS